MRMNIIFNLFIAHYFANAQISNETSPISIDQSNTTAKSTLKQKYWIVIGKISLKLTNQSLKRIIVIVLSR